MSSQTTTPTQPSSSQETVPVPTNQNKDSVRRFKVAVHVVNALRRFQDALNPTYEYGSSKSGDLDQVETKPEENEEVMSPRGPLCFFPRRRTQQKSTSFSYHGQKSRYLMGPLRS
eukprot:TRINITY_DN2313_c0_g1_i1.p5 TRINITY_DN2313_c0_g1~~TRINITY_DN2313_c0_g1_i1.p5  ORF type:complete len:115 (+),score=12.43 TRINITY_DN2313_c0_g1_i1:104-448(+)